MNGAESLLRTLLAGGIDVCFTTPAAAGSDFAAAFDRLPGIRLVPGLDEGIATGAANGYARMAEGPGVALLSLGPGLASGAANLGDAACAHLPIVNLIRETARDANGRDRAAALESEEMLRAHSGWLHVSASAGELGRQTADALLAARTAPGGVATLIVPTDAAAGSGGRAAAVFNPPRPPMPDSALISRIACLLRSEASAAILLGGTASCGDGLMIAGRIAAATGAALVVPCGVRRLRRGAGLSSVECLPAAASAASRYLGQFSQLVLAGAHAPRICPHDPPVGEAPCRRVITLAGPEEDAVGALEALAVALSAHATPPRAEAMRRPPCVSGPITVSGVAAVVGSLLPEHAVVADDSPAAGREIFAECRGAPPHDWMAGTSGPIGLGLPLAIGAAIACPERKVLCLSAGAAGTGAMQALWTMAREGRCVTVLVFAGGKRVEPDRLMLAREHGVPGRRVDALEDLAEALRGGFASGGPSLIEVPL